MLHTSTFGQNTVWITLSLLLFCSIFMPMHCRKYYRSKESFLKEVGHLVLAVCAQFSSP